MERRAVDGQDAVARRRRRTASRARGRARATGSCGARAARHSSALVAGLAQVARRVGATWTSGIRRGPGRHSNAAARSAGGTRRAARVPARGGSTASSVARPGPTRPRGRARRRRRPSARPASSSAGRRRRAAARGSPRRSGSAACRGCRGAQECSDGLPRHPARKARIDATACSPPNGAPRDPREKTSSSADVFAAQPPPDRPQEAGVVHRAVPAVAVEVRGESRASARRRAGRRRPACEPAGDLARSGRWSP